MLDLDRSTIVADIVTENPAAARVFQKHGIDYCCRGNLSVATACERAGLDADALLTELGSALAASGPSPEEDPRTLSTSALIARIIDRHHGFLRRALPFIAPIAAKVAEVHGAHNAKLLPLHEAFLDLAEALLPHLDHEEAVLFPALLTRSPDPSLLQDELAAMNDEHLAVGELLASIRTLTDGYTTPEWGCNTYRVLMAELEAVEADILRHVHLENHVLAPRVAASIGQKREPILSHG